MLGAATVVTAFVAEILVGTLQAFAEDFGLSDFFVAAVIVAIVGNAAEHGGAVVVAYKGNLKLAAEIALASSAQVAVFLIPAVALISWLIEPLALSFRQIELLAMGGSVVFAAASPRQRTLDPLARRRADRRLRRRGVRLLRRRRPLRRGSVNRTSGLALPSLWRPRALGTIDGTPSPQEVS